MKVAIVGTGNIGTDLLEKLRRSRELEVALFAGIDRASPGLARADSYGVPTAVDGADSVLAQADDIELVFEATSAAVHRTNAPRYAAAGLTAIDLTPAKLGPAIVPAVNGDDAGSELNVSLTTCGGQATIPIVAALARIAHVDYAEIVSTISSVSAGPGTRQNIDEFTYTTAAALQTVGGARRGKAIIILNPADPPILMRNSISALVPEHADTHALAVSVEQMARDVSWYVPGYRVKAGPEFDRLESGHLRVSVSLEVAGAGDFLPAYAGNLDIMTSAAVAVGERLARARAGVPA